MPRYKVNEEFVIHGNRHLAGDVIEMTEETMKEWVAEAAKDKPPVALKLEALPEPPAAEGHKPTMKPIDLPSGMKPADIPYTEPPRTKPAPKTATR